jgi:hypothetical protein
MDCPQCAGRFDALAGLVDEEIPGGDPDEDEDVGLEQQMEPEPAPLMTFTEDPRRESRTGTVLWTLGLILLLVGIAAQAFWWERGTWLGHPQARETYERLCAELAVCPPLPRLAGTIDIMEPVLSEDPEADSLRLNLTLVNHADQLQRLPVLQLELYDGVGNLEAAGRFSPQEYLPLGESTRGLAAGSAVNVALEIAAPAEAPSAFRVKLY